MRIKALLLGAALGVGLLPEELSARPEKVRTKGYPAIVIGEEQPKYRGEPISLDVKDADLRDVILTFAKLVRANFVIDPDVRGSVTARLSDVPWDQALELILRQNGLGYVLEGKVLKVGKPVALGPRRP